ncbi:MAG: bacillithiol biosynthesis deacetylase BshB1 [Cytophagales bacterium]
MELDILAFAAHPDDVELSAAGTLMAHIEKGYKVGILDFTRGELGSRGSADLRDMEAKDSTKILNLNARENLLFADGFFENNKEHQLEIIKQIRKYRPKIVLLNAPEDRHPDHRKAAQLGNDACFLSGLLKIETKLNGEFQKEWRPKLIYHYIQDRLLPQDFVVDITPFFERKMNAIKAFKSQFFDPESQEPATYISDPKYFDYVEARMLEYGHSIGVKYAEGFIKQRQIGVSSLFDLI